MPFELLTPTPAKLTSVTPRTEKHGDSDVFAISLGLTITGANTLLDLLSPGLRATLYKAVEGQEQLPGVEEATPLLRTRVIELLTLKGALEGWTLTVDHGIDDADPITLGGCKVDKFRVKAHEGGSIDLMCRAGSNDVDAAEAGLLCSHLAQEINVTLRAPAIKADPIDGTTGHEGLAALNAAEAAGQGSLLTPEDALASSLVPTDPRGHGPDADEADDDSEGGAPDVDDDTEGLEAGMASSIQAAGVKPRGRKTVARH